MALTRKLYRHMIELIEAEQDHCNRASLLTRMLKDANISLTVLATFAQDRGLDFSSRGSYRDVPAIAEAYLYQAARRGLTQEEVIGELTSCGLLTSPLIGWETLIRSAKQEREVFGFGESYARTSPALLARHLNLLRIAFPDEIDETTVRTMCLLVVDEGDSYLSDDSATRRIIVWGKSIQEWAES